MSIFPLHCAIARSGPAAASAHASFAPSRLPVLSSTAVLGIAIVSLLPALFWTALIWATGYVFGWNISTGTLATIASTIAVFLGVVCSAIISAA